MNVAELIENLKTIDQTLRVSVYVSDREYHRDTDHEVVLSIVGHSLGECQLIITPGKEIE